MKVRIGIDVGGTFTDAVAIDDTTFELVGSVKVPTTHTAREGVAAGIIESLHRLMDSAGLSADQVVFIAHGTTQATNALLEGDVSPVGIITLGSGIEGVKARADTQMGVLELAPGKTLKTSNEYIDRSAATDLPEAIDAAIERLCSAGASSIVAAEAFSVDDGSGEGLVTERGNRAGLPSTATNEISKLYGLKTRTRTAVVNASIMPRMLQTAAMTESAIKAASITSPLMVMRCDGGVMTVDEVRRRPILTILSGPAAGVAGALMYERLTDGLFFEVGGTSTDISCVKDGRVQVAYSQVGGHKTYLSSLDVRTVGVGGGSMVEVSGGRPVATGLRSAHIAGLEYEVYSPPLTDPVLIEVRPLAGDPAYAAVRGADGSRRALTLAGAANIAGLVPASDYAHGDAEAARTAWRPLASSMGVSVEDAARTALELASAKNRAVAQALMREYGMDPRTTVFIGGGGGASTAVPHLAGEMGVQFRTARNAAVISPIGVALAMVRDTVERTVVDPTEDDIVRIRNEARGRAERSGAAPGTIEVTVEVDTQRNLVRAVAVGATEMRSGDRSRQALDDAELVRRVADNLGAAPDACTVLGATATLRAVRGRVARPRLLGLIKRFTTPLRVIDTDGVIRLQKSGGNVFPTTAGAWEPVVRRRVDEAVEYNDGGASLPNTYVLIGKRIVDLSGMRSVEQLTALARAELAGLAPDEPVVVIVTGRTD